MKNLFEHTSSPWIRYSSYEYRTAEDGTLYIVVSADAKPEMYNPMKDAESLVLAAVNIGLQVMHKAPEDELKSMVLRFINSYGFLGFMTALPTTAEFITYESVYLPKTILLKKNLYQQKVISIIFIRLIRWIFTKRGRIKLVGIRQGWHCNRTCNGKESTGCYDEFSERICRTL